MNLYDLDLEEFLNRTYPYLKERNTSGSKLYQKLLKKLLNSKNDPDIIRHASVLWRESGGTSEFGLVKRFSCWETQVTEFSIFKIASLKQFYRSRNPKLFEKSHGDVAEPLNELVQNLNSVYSAEISESGLYWFPRSSVFLAENSENFWENIQDLGMVLNSILSLIVTSAADKISKLVTVFCDKIVSAQLPERCGIVKLRV